jgi:CheY-like chemotaxis protein
VVGNLLANAAKYTDRGGRIALSVSTAGRTAEIRVRDSGIGIPPDQLHRIFDLFAQAEGADRGSGGLGIGLALVERLVELHGGTVTAHSEGPGRGSEFIVQLPRMETAAPSAPATPDAVPKRGGGATSRRRILIVDDNRDALESLATLLELSGHVVCAAPNGEAALALAASFRPDLVLLDLGMPKVDGYEVARRIRAEPWGKAMTLVALTGWGHDEDRRRTRACGFDSHMVKPLDFEVLAALLARLPAGLTHS